MPDAFTVVPRVAYFSMEIALEPEVPTYAGGLGVLAGDTLRSAADLALPLVAVSLVSHQGFFRQVIDDAGRQTEQPDPWDVAAKARPLDAKVGLRIDGRKVWVGAWLYVLTSETGHEQPVILLDTALDENDPADRGLTDHLYGGDLRYRLQQEIVLGVGGVRMLRALGFEISQYHMNEGHSALLGLELLRRMTFPADVIRVGDSPFDLPRVRELCCFTTHTPVEAGHDRFPYALVAELLGDSMGVDIESLKKLAGPLELNMTRLALNLSEYVNGVAKRHAEISAEMFPGYTVHAVTNGVHASTWTCEPFRALFDRHLPGWCHEPELLLRADCCIPDDAIWNAHCKAKQALIDEIDRRTGKRLDADSMIVGFARRMTAYKRPDLLFTDLDRLRRIAATRPLQIVLAGKAHPRDEEGKRLIELLHGHARELGDALPIVYLANYEMDLASRLVAGVDVWLNTPLRPREASGTSGMKATFNGIPNLSILDGWWIEGCIEGITGWGIGASSVLSDGDAASLYDKLEHDVLPIFYDDRTRWIAIMKAAIAKNASYFTSHRMMRRYASEAYLK